MAQRFFTLTPSEAREYRKLYYTQIHEICFHGQGGYTWSEVYNMPIWLRKFTYQKLVEHYTEKNKDPKNPMDNLSQLRKTLTPQGNSKTPTPKSRKNTAKVSED